MGSTFTLVISVDIYERKKKLKCQRVGETGRSQKRLMPTLPGAR
jgi:hypothetical protein